MDSIEVLTTLEAELRKLDVQRADLARAIETIRRIIVVGRPETARQPGSPVAPAEGKTTADRAIAYLQSVGGRAKMKALVEAVGNPSRNPNTEYGSIFRGDRGRVFLRLGRNRGRMTRAAI